MQRRAERIVVETLLPETRREFVHLAGRMLGDTLQHIDQIVVRVDLVETAGDDQALHDADVLGSEFGPTEHPGFSAHRNCP